MKESTNFYTLKIHLMQIILINLKFKLSIFHAGDIILIFDKHVIMNTYHIKLIIIKIITIQYQF